MLRLEADLSLLQGVDQAGVLFLLVGGPEPGLDFTMEAGQLLPFLLALRPVNGSREFVEQMSQVLFHGGQRYRTSGLYLMRWGWAASAPRRFFRSVS